MGEEQRPSEQESEEQRSSWLGRVMTWVLGAAIAFAIIKMQDAKRDAWFEAQHQKSVGWCNGNAECATSVERHWQRCVEDNHKRTGLGRFNRSYSIDDDALRMCLIATGADPVAVR